MRRKDELADSESCFNRAKPNEMVFVLLGRDIAAQEAILAWVQARIRLGKNKLTDPQIQEALFSAGIMEQER